eukprot:scaffold350914_cov35-Attheya_sp.AAC.1
MEANRKVILESNSEWKQYCPTVPLRRTGRLPVSKNASAASGGRRPAAGGGRGRLAPWHVI